MNVFSKVVVAGALAVTSLASYAYAQDVLNVTAESLSKEFRANQLKAEKKYKDTAFNVKGFIASVGKSYDKKVYVQLGRKDSSIPIVQAYLIPDAVDKAADLDKGNEVTLHCASADKPHVVVAYSCDIVE